MKIDVKKVIRIVLIVLVLGVFAFLCFRYAVPLTKLLVTEEGREVICEKVESYGVFVELFPNLAGLAEYKEGVVPGDPCAVFIKSIIPEKMKVKLVLVDCGGGEVRIPVRYYLDAENTRRIDRWRYSPACCSRVIETVFS